MRIVRQIKECNHRKLRVDGIANNKEIQLDCFSALVENTTEDTVLHIYTDSDELIKSVAYNSSYTLVEESTLLCTTKIIFKIQFTASFDDSFDGSFA